MKLGLIAGNGSFPFLVLEGARKAGVSVAVAAIREETVPQIEKLSENVTWVGVGQLGKLLRFFKKEGVERKGVKPPLESETAMRFIVMVKANKDSEAGVLPTEEQLREMGKFNDELAKAGVMLAGEGLHASSRGARLTYSGSKRTVRDGPFAETKELVAGFWIWQVKSKQEALEWAKRIPFKNGEEVEIRQVFEAEDFGDAFTPELRQQEQRQRAAIDKNKQRAGR